jgi:hypothetical protein
MKSWFATKSIAVESERIQHPPHLAFRRPLRLGRARTRGRTLLATRRAARLRRRRVVEIFQLECPAKPLQFENQRRALWPDRPVLGCADAAWRHAFFMRTVHELHDATLSASFG